MAINIKLNLTNRLEPPTMLLANRNGNILGQLKVNKDSIDISDKFNDASEFSFTLNKYYDGELVTLWDKVLDFKLVYCEEWDVWFEIKVELDEETKTVKTVYCTQLGQSELSQIKLYNVEINTEDDIARDDYKISILRDENDPKASILDRMLEKAPHYSIGHVDDTIKNIQRSFSFDDKSIYDSFQEVGEEIGCLFIFPSNSVNGRKINRTVSVYDLQQNCNSCGHRGEFTDKCPKCGSDNIKYGYGEDTLIFVTSDELASSGIQLKTDTGAVKNCFKLEAGDNLMTATIRNRNPNGSDYIWYFSDAMKEDMPDEMVNKIEKYDKLYNYYYTDTNEIPDGLDSSDIKIEKPFVLNDDLVSNYNALVEKYKGYYNTASTCLSCGYEEVFSGDCPKCGSGYVLAGRYLQPISTNIMSFSSLMEAYYNTIDLALFLESGLMPSIEIGETDAEKQGLLLELSLPSLIAVANLETVSLATANSTVLSMARAIVGSSYKVEISSSELTDGEWSGHFVITNYSDEEDTYTTELVSRTLTDWDEEFIKQKLEKLLGKENTDDLSVSGLFEKELVTTVVNGEYNFSGEFYDELKKYALNPLISFREVCQSCIDVLIEQGVGNSSSWSDEEEGSSSNLYESLYVPYYNKLMAIESEIKIREGEVNVITSTYDTNGNLKTKGLQTDIEECRNKIQNELNFENYLGTDLWLEFCAYRREDKYSNDNYISDGLNNSELFKRALEFFEVAENEIYKSAELQHSISTTLKNLLAIPKFESLVDSFKVGNWIRVQIDDKIYKLRLLEYGISFGDLNDISVEFSDVTKVKNGISDVKSILSQASSMATSYGSTQRQAGQGAKSNSIVNSWVESGLNATKTKIVDSYDENLMFGKNAFWCRQYDPITDTYSDEQIKIVNSTIAITDNNWATTKTAIGKIYYIDPTTKELKESYGVNGETIVGKLLIGEQLDITNDNGTLEFGANGFVVENENNAVVINPNNESIFDISNNDNSIFSLDENGELVIIGNITAKSLTLEEGVKIDSSEISNLQTIALTGSYNDLKDVPDFADVAMSGEYSDLKNKPKLSSVAISGSYNDLSNKPDLSAYYDKTEVNNMLNLKVNTEDLSTVATTGSYNDLTDISEFKNWVLEQIQLAINQQTDNP